MLDRTEGRVLRAHGIGDARLGEVLAFVDRHPRAPAAAPLGHAQRISAHLGDAAKAPWIKPTWEYAWGKFPHMRKFAVS